MSTHLFDLTLEPGQVIELTLDIYQPISLTVDASIGEIGPQGPIGPRGPAGEAGVKNILTSQIDGSNINFSTSQEFKTGSTQVYLNGLLLDEEDYIEAISSIILEEAPLPGDRLTILYIST